jgi:hypothetical protein
MRPEHEAGRAEAGGNPHDRPEIFRVLHVGADDERRPRAGDDLFQRRRRGAPAAREDAAVEVEADQGLDGVVGDDERGKISRQQRCELSDVRLAEQHRLQREAGAQQTLDQLISLGDEESAPGRVVGAFQGAIRREARVVEIVDGN